MEEMFVSFRQECVKGTAAILISVTVGMPECECALRMHDQPLAGNFSKSQSNTAAW